MPQDGKVERITILMTREDFTISMYQLAVNERRLLTEFPAFFYNLHRARVGSRLPWDIRLDGGGP